MDNAAPFLHTSISRRKNPSLCSRISSINKLNQDLLGYIIYLCSSEDGVSTQYTLRNTARFSSQVNTHWRSLSLRNKTIWLGPVLDWFSPPKWVAEVLRRSDPLPLDVIIPLDAANRCPLVVSVALLYLCRMRTLELTLEDNAWWWFITQSNQLKTRAPLLQKLIVDIRSGVQPKRRLHSAESLSMFGGHAPRLQHLQVRNCSLNLTQLASSALRVLVIEDIQYIPIPELLDMLRQMKCLESLQIVLPLESAAIHDVYVSSAYICDVHLLNLAELRVSAPSSTCAKLLHALVLPSSCALVIDAQHDPSSHDGQDLLTIISRFESILGNWACEPLMGRQYLRFGMDEVGFSVDAPQDDNIASHPLLSLTFWWAHDASQVEMLFAFLPLLISLFSRSSRLPDSLSISVSRGVPPELYPDLRSLLIPWLKSVKYIQAIEFQSHNAFALMEKLFLGPRLDILLPHLSDMTFVKVDFTTQKRRYWRRLLKVLKFRASDRVDAPILQLDFIHCVGDFRRENLGGRFGTMVKINGNDCSDDDDEADEASDYTVQDFSD